MLLTLLEVIMRYVFHHPLMVADEFGAYMVVFVGYVALAQTWREKGHVRITALVGILPPKVASWVRLVALLIAFVTVIMICKGSYSFLVDSFELHQRSASWLNTPLQGPHMTILIGFSLLALLLIGEIAKGIVKIRSGKSIEETT